jgi:hypothetical protein
MAKRDMDPAVKAIQDQFEQNLTDFMSSLGPTLARYTMLLQRALPHNPKACYYAVEQDESSADEPAAKKARTESEKPSPVKNPTSPLLRRPKLDPELVEEMKRDALTDFPFPLMAPPSSTKAGTTAASPIDKSGAKKQNEKTMAEMFAEVAPPPLLLSQIRILKTEARQLWHTFERIHDWVALNIPQIGDENAGPGVEVMGMVISELEEMMNTAKVIYMLEMKYLGDRADLELRIAKYTATDNARRALEVYDANSWDDVEKGYRSLMRATLIAHSTLSKNMKRLKQPMREMSAAFLHM